MPPQKQGDQLSSRSNRRALRIGTVVHALDLPLNAGVAGELHVSRRVGDGGESGLFILVAFLLDGGGGSSLFLFHRGFRLGGGLALGLSGSADGGVLALALAVAVALVVGVLAVRWISWLVENGMGVVGNAYAWPFFLVTFVAVPFLVGVLRWRLGVLVSPPSAPPLAAAADSVPSSPSASAPAPAPPALPLALRLLGVFLVGVSDEAATSASPALALKKFFFALRYVTLAEPPFL